VQGVAMITPLSSKPICPVCGGCGDSVAFPYRTIWNGRRFDYRNCENCGSTFVDPLPSNADLGAMYSRESYHDKFYSAICVEPYKVSLREVAHLLPREGKMLDFGCGNGSFIIAARAAGYDCEGVELEASTIRYAAENSGARVHSLAAVLAAGTQYSVIHLSDVLHHLSDPISTMRTLEHMLAVGGVFFLEGPLENNPSPVYFASKIVGAVKRHIGKRAGEFPPYQIFRTSAKAQRNFFVKCLGYELQFFSVQETGWPYTTGSLLSSSFMSNLLRLLIAAIAIGLARFTKGTFLHLGNRFRAVALPASHQGRDHPARSPSTLPSAPKRAAKHKFVAESDGLARRCHARQIGPDAKWSSLILKAVPR
jgi:SAM-dependent methyltransferase